MRYIAVLILLSTACSTEQSPDIQATVDVSVQSTIEAQLTPTPVPTSTPTATPAAILTQAPTATSTPLPAPIGVTVVPAPTPTPRRILPIPTVMPIPTPTPFIIEGVRPEREIVPITPVPTPPVVTIHVPGSVAYSVEALGNRIGAYFEPYGEDLYIADVPNLVSVFTYADKPITFFWMYVFDVEDLSVMAAIMLEEFTDDKSLIIDDAIRLAEAMIREANLQQSYTLCQLSDELELSIVPSFVNEAAGDLNLWSVDIAGSLDKGYDGSGGKCEDWQ